MKYALAVTVHDPSERHLARFSPGLLELAHQYGVKAATCTAETSSRTVKALEEAGFDTRRSRGRRIGQSRRDALKDILQHQTVSWIHYADLDRLLHWQYTYPSELAETLRVKPLSEYVAVGRTERALRTHPRVQVLAETLTNEAFSTVMGLGQCGDLVAGSCLLSRRAAELVVRLSVEPTNATDIEWPALVVRNLGVMPEFRAIEGLEFETADYYPDEIRDCGSLAAWISEVYDRPSVWEERTRLAHDSIVALARVLASSRAIVERSCEGQVSTSGARLADRST